MEGIFFFPYWGVVSNSYNQDPSPLKCSTISERLFRTLEYNILLDSIHKMKQLLNNFIQSKRRRDNKRAHQYTSPSTCEKIKTHQLPEALSSFLDKHISKHTTVSDPVLQFNRKDEYNATSCGNTATARQPHNQETKKRIKKHFDTMDLRFVKGSRASSNNSVRKKRIRQASNTSLVSRNTRTTTTTATRRSFLEEKQQQQQQQRQHTVAAIDYPNNLFDKSNSDNNDPALILFNNSDNSTINERMDSFSQEAAGDTSEFSQFLFSLDANKRTEMDRFIFRPIEPHHTAEIKNSVDASFCTSASPNDASEGFLDLGLVDQPNITKEMSPRTSTDSLLSCDDNLNFFFCSNVNSSFQDLTSNLICQTTPILFDHGEARPHQGYSPQQPTASRRSFSFDLHDKRSDRQWLLQNN